MLPEGMSDAFHVPVGELLAGDSPRLRGPDAEHARLLSQTGASLPPIIVHRRTMQVIDGIHRLQAAKLRGDKTVPVRFFEGSAEDAFVIAVWANVTHGKPLTLKDREAAAKRVLISHPAWSDRAIGDACGLSPRTVGQIREHARAMPFLG